LQWARPLATKADLDKLKSLVIGSSTRDSGKIAGSSWNVTLSSTVLLQLSGNAFLAETLERLMAPLFAFVVLASGAPLTASMGREHYTLIEALRSVEEPEFSTLVRKTFTGFAFRWISSASPKAQEPTPA